MSERWRAQARSAVPLGTPTLRAASRSVAALCSKARGSSSDTLGSRSFTAPCRPTTVGSAIVTSRAFR
jgi:hypothetical protein